MRLTFRLFLLALAAWHRKKNCALTDESVLHLRVLPWDCIVRLVGNDRYHAYMDLGRIDLMLRIGWGKTVWTNKLSPFVRTADIQYFYPLRMFDRFTLRTSIIYWDDYNFWMEHFFDRKGRTLAIAISKNVVKGKNGLFATEDAIQVLHQAISRPPCPSIVQLLDEQEELMKNLRVKPAETSIEAL